MHTVHACVPVYMYIISKFWCMKWIVKHMLVSDLRNMLLLWLALGYLFIDHFIVPPLKTKGILFCTWWAGGLWTKQCPFNIFWLHHLKIAKLGTVYALEIRWPLLILRSHGPRSNCWSLYKWRLFNISWPLWWKVAKLGTVDDIESRWPILNFRTHGQRSRSNWWSWNKWCMLNICWPLCWKVAKLGTLNASRE